LSYSCKTANFSLLEVQLHDQHSFDFYSIRNDFQECGLVSCFTVVLSNWTECRIWIFNIAWLL